MKMYRSSCKTPDTNEKACRGLGWSAQGSAGSEGTTIVGVLVDCRSRIVFVDENVRNRDAIEVERSPRVTFEHLLKPFQETPDILFDDALCDVLVRLRRESTTFNIDALQSVSLGC